MLNYGLLVVIHFQVIVRAWRKGLRQIWELPNTFCTDYLSTIFHTDPIYDVLCRHFLNFITTCYVSDSELIQFIAKHAVFCAHAQSPFGHNYALCYERYGFKVEDEVKSGHKSSCCNNDALKQMSATDYCHVNLALELIMLRTGILFTPDCEWSWVQIDCMLSAVGTR